MAHGCSGRRWAFCLHIERPCPGAREAVYYADSHIMTTKPSRFLLAVIAGWLFVQPGCGRSPSPSAAMAVARRVLSSEDAAELAARLANAKCESQYRKHPFRADQYSAFLEEGEYRWGGLDIGGP